MEELNKVILEAMPIGVQCWDEDCRIISCNESIVRLFGLSGKQEYLEKFSILSPEYQPDGQVSEELARKYVKEAFAKGSVRFEWTHVGPHGEFIPVEVSLIRTRYQGRALVIGYTTDLRAVKAAQAKTREAEIATKAKSDFPTKMSREIHAHFVAPTVKILLVDDSRTNLMVAERLMAPYEMQVDTCLSGREAIRLIKENKYDIIFMDYMMPQMDGVETTNIIRALKDGGGYYQNVPIIALTANAVVGIREMFLQNGMNDFLPKPIESLKLNSILAKWVPKKKRKKPKKTGAKDIQPELAIAGLNVKDGILMTGGSFENYLKTLVLFRNDSLRKITEIKNCLQKNNIKLYTIYVHAIKSASSSIGAPEISEFAKKLEDAGNRKDVIFIMENNEKFLNELETLLDNIKNAADKYQIKAAGGDHADLSTLKNELLKLKIAFQNMDIREIDNTLNGLGKKRWYKKISDAIDSIAQNVLLSDYDEALKTIDTLLDIFEE